MSALAAAGLLERDDELRMLDAAVAALGRGHGSVVVLHGPAGIGKTQLMRAALNRARAAGLRTPLARASEFERGFAFGVVRQLFEPVAAAMPEHEREQLFAGAARLARGTLGAAVDEEAGRSDSSYATLHGLYWLCVNLSDRGPLVLAVDDLQWADAASLRWISFLARRIEGLPVLLVATLRADGPGGDDAAVHDVVVNRLARVVRPAALTERAVGTLVGRALDAEADPEFVSACHRATRGNPLFLAELLSTLREQGVAPLAGEAGRVGDVGPRAVTRLVLGRLAALGPAAEHLARVAALVGDGADDELVRRTAQLESAAFAEAAQRLAGADLVTVEPRVAFTHPVSRAAIAAALEPAELAALSRRAASVLAERGDLEGVGSHLLAVPPASDAGAVFTLRQAGARALARGAPEAAVALLQRALVEPPPADDEAAVLHELALAELRTRATIAPVHLRAALDLTPPGPLRARRADDLARALHNLNRSREAVAVAEQALAELGPDDAPVRDRLAARAVELARFVPEGHVVQRRVAEPLAALSDPTMLARVRAVRAYDAMLACAPAAQVAADARRALHGGALVGDIADGSMPVFLACMALGISGDPDGAGREIERALETARHRGSIVSYTGALSIRARLRLVRSDLRGAEADAREIEDLGDEGLGRDYVAGWLVESLVSQGRLDEAEQVVRDGVLAGEIPALIVFNAGLHARGRLRIAQGRAEEGLRDVLRCGERQEAAGAPNPADVPWRGTAARALLDLGRHAQADRFSAEHLAAAQAFGAPAVVGEAQRIRGLVVGGEEGRALVDEAVALLAHAPAPLERARALLAVGPARHAMGDAEGARAALGEARSLAEQCGAEPVAAAAIEATLAAGGRPRRARAQGHSSLTPAERRTVEQAVRGLSNREIAQALFVTEKTVEGHLRNAYRKLGITSRSQLPAAFESGPTDRPGG